MQKLSIELFSSLAIVITRFYGLRGQPIPRGSGAFVACRALIDHYVKTMETER